MPTNILLVVLDCARRDALEPYGAAVGSTPAIADLARRGHALPRAYATSSWTLPSHVSMFTGLLPRRVGLTQAPGGTPQGVRPRLEQTGDRMLSSVLKAAGYATYGWSTNLWASPHTGFDIGFDRFELINSGRVERVNALVGGGLRAKLAWAREGFSARSDDGALRTGQALRDSIARWSGQPTFWFVNLSECHSPYLPPRPWNDLGAAERVRAALDCERHLSFLAICLYAAGRHDIEPEALERMRYLYDRSVTYMDDWMATVLQALADRHILDETLVIVAADHGENFGEAGLIAHGFSLDERLIHVPLVMAGPGTVAREDVISLAELPRLIVQAAGIEDHPFGPDQLPSGVAIAQYDPMGGREHPAMQAFVKEWGVDEEGAERLSAGFTSATDGRRKLVLRDGDERLFDIDSDPDERRSLQSCNGSLAALRTALGHPAAGDGGSVASGAEAAAPSASTDELAQIERQMKLLGYM